MKKKLLLILTPTLIIIWFIAIYQLANPKTEYFFPKQSDYTITGYSDQEDPILKGNSRLLTFGVDKNINIEAILDDEIPSPYAGFRISLPERDPFFDISSFDRIEIAVDSTNASSFILDITTFVADYTELKDQMSFRHHYALVNFDSNSKSLSLSLDSVKGDGWWSNFRNSCTSSDKLPNFKKCHSLSLEMTGLAQDKGPLFVSISQIKFVAQKRGLAYFALISTLCYIILILIKEPQETPVDDLSPSRKLQEIHCKPLALKNQEEEELERLCIYLGDNYHKPQLSITQVAKETGITVDRIPQILMRSYRMQYKQYLNTIRVKEAKRLLSNTDRQISEISVAVGYNYPSTFNRIFKDFVGHSPRKYRNSLINN